MPAQFRGLSSSYLQRVECKALDDEGAAPYHGKGGVSRGEFVKFWCSSRRKEIDLREGLASNQNVRPSSVSMAWRMRAGTGCGLLDS